jgi:hypothetical protein
MTQLRSTRGTCKEGHNLAVHGYIRPDNGYVICRECQRERKLEREAG